MVASGADIGLTIPAMPVQLDNGPLDGKTQPLCTILKPGNDLRIRQKLDRMALIADHASVEGLLPQHIG